jgi:hypothetical protein
MNTETSKGGYPVFMLTDYLKESRGNSRAHFRVIPSTVLKSYKPGIEAGPGKGFACWIDSEAFRASASL